MSLANFGLDLGIGRTSDEDAGSEKVFKGVEELTPEERSKETVYYARGSVGIQKLMREMQIETEKKPPVPPKARPATAEPKSTAVMPLSKKQHAMPSAAASSSSSSGLLRPTEVPGKSSGAAPIEPKQPPTPKKMPTTAIKSPPAAKAIAKSEASPPGRDGQFWIAGTDLPPLASDHRYLNAQKCEKLGRKISFILRGFTNKPEFGTRTPNIDWAPDDLSADWNEFTDALSQIWTGLRMSNIFEVFKYPEDGKARYEVLIQRHNDQEFDILRARAIHGHWSGLMTDQIDVKDTHQAVYTFVAWDASLTTRPKILPNDMYSDEYMNFPVKIGYHGTYMRHFADIVRNGLLPGGATLHESGSRAFVMMCRDPEWIRNDNAGLRERAEVEFVIDLQMAVRDGLRLFETRSGALESPDWVSNKYLIYAYQRGTAEPIWVNPVYQAFRRRIDSALARWNKGEGMPYTFDPSESIYSENNCMLDLLDEAENHTIAEWAPCAKDCKTPYRIAGHELKEVGDEVIEHRATNDQLVQGFDGTFGISLCVWPSRAGKKVPIRTRREPWHWIKQEIISYPGYHCSSCNQKYIEGMIQCPGCERRLVAQTDFSIIAEPDRLRRNAAREGREVSIIDLQPSSGLSRQRVRTSGEDESQTQKVQSTASTIRAKVLNQQKRADKLNQTTPQGQFSVDPIQAHNFAKAGLSFHTVEALQRFANVRLPNPQGKGKGTGTSTWYDASGKLALLWVPGQQNIDLLTECLICFHDRFYTIDEIAVLIKAVKSNQHEFTVLCYDGEKHCIVQHEILAIMGELATLFAREIPKSRSSNERSYPTLTNQG